MVVARNALREESCSLLTMMFVFVFVFVFVLAPLLLLSEREFDGHTRAITDKRVVMTFLGIMMYVERMNAFYVCVCV